MRNLELAICSGVKGRGSSKRQTLSHASIILIGSIERCNLSFISTGPLTSLHNEKLDQRQLCGFRTRSEAALVLSMSLKSSQHETQECIRVEKWRVARREPAVCLNTNLFTIVSPFLDISRILHPCFLLCVAGLLCWLHAAAF